ncbi:MAG: energy-coupling factor transporter transmembrane protein EcfT, partial [Clostridia bacterium]|nr:energy-coupling factor transporter transmembrane protein EcfT [Clostridia bacterium]
LAKTPAAYLLMIVFTISMALVSQIKIKVILKGLKPLLVIIIITSIVNLFFAKGGELLVDWKFIHIYSEGIKTAVYMMIRIVCLVMGTSVVLTYTTSPIQLTDGLEQLLAPLKAIKLPVHEFSMMMTIALRFIPTLIRETDKIMSAQKARGADFTTGKLHERIKALIPVLIPLFISAFRRADELATAMECRCYHGGDGRTKMTRLKMHAVDYVFFAIFAAFIAGLVLLGKITFPF